MQLLRKASVARVSMSGMHCRQPHVPEVCRRDPVNFGKRSSQVPACQIDQVYTLIDEFTSAGFLWIGSPFALVTNATAMPVPTSDKHQRSERARVNERPCLAQRWMIAMVESNPDSTVVSSSRVDELIELGNGARTWFFHQHVLARFDGRHAHRRQPVVRCRDEHQVDIGADDGIFPTRDRGRPRSSCGQLDRASGHQICARNKTGACKRCGSFLTNPSTPDDCDTGSRSQRSPQGKPRSFGTMRRSV